jgi:hypothetical protein
MKVFEFLKNVENFLCNFHTFLLAISGKYKKLNVQKILGFVSILAWGMC